MSKKNLESLIDEALENIRNDRKAAREFLSPVAAKHIETLQRSNEQLVKLIAIQKKNDPQESSLSEEDKDSLFDLIQGGA